MHVRGRKILYVLGSGVAFFGAAFTVLQIVRQWSLLEITHLGGSFWWLMVGCSFAYAFANVLLTFGWMNLLRHLNEMVAAPVALVIYGTTVPAKYIPGNIFHLAGRQALGMAMGIDGWRLAKASVYELTLIDVAGLLFSILVLPQLLTYDRPGMTLVCFFIATCATALAIYSFSGRWLLLAFLDQMIFLFCCALIFTILIAYLVGDFEWTLARSQVFGGAFILAWVVGLITPGAPAGVGVRELVLIACLGGLVAGQDLLSAVILSRLATVAGDVLFFGMARLLSNNRGASETH